MEYFWRNLVLCSWSKNNNFLKIKQREGGGICAPRAKQGFALLQGSLNGDQSESYRKYLLHWSNEYLQQQKVVS